MVMALKVWLIVAGILLGARAVFGCTAVEGTDPIGDSDRMALTLGFISALIVVTSVAFYYLRGWKGLWALILSVVLLAIHPAWTVSSRIGDCGTAKVAYSTCFTAFVVLLTLYQGIRWFLGRDKRI